MRPERRRKSGMEGGFTAASFVSPLLHLRTAVFLSNRWGPPHSTFAGPLAAMAVAGGNLYVRVTEGLNFNEASPIRSIAKLHTPVLLIHGLADTRTPPSHSQELAAANPAHTQLWLVPGAKHVGAYTTAPSEFRDRVLNFFRQ